MIEETTACVACTNVFLHPLIDDSTAPTTRGERREQQMLRAQAAKMCAECPMLAQCLTDAVVKFDVAGFVGGTTRRQRHEIRARLGIAVALEDLDAFAGVSSGRQFDGHEIHRMRTAHPEQPLSAIAAKVGCSISTVKRHLRRIEAEGTSARPVQKKAPAPARIVAVAEDVKRGARRVAA